MFRKIHSKIISKLLAITNVDARKLTWRIFYFVIMFIFYHSWELFSRHICLHETLGLGDLAVSVCNLESGRMLRLNLPVYAWG